MALDPSDAALRLGIRKAALSQSLVWLGLKLKSGVATDADRSRFKVCTDTIKLIDQVAEDLGITHELHVQFSREVQEMTARRASC